ncbi:hypothetical protein D3C81_1589460 [compost metagenome]
MKNIASFKPQSTDEWQEKTEKMDLNLLKKQLEDAATKKVDLLYIGKDHEKYSGVILTVKGSE